VSKMNGRTRKKFFGLLWRRDGPYCKCCGKLAWERSLVIDHRDNDNSNNSPENHQLLCRSCNYLKNPRRPVDMCVRNSPPILHSSLSVNRDKEPKFREWVLEELERKGAVDGANISAEYVINTGAEKVGISPETVKKYLKKMCSTVGQLERSDFGISIKQVFVPKIVL